MTFHCTMVAFGVAHRRGAGLDPAIFAIEAPQAVPARIRLTGGKEWAYAP